MQNKHEMEILVVTYRVTKQRQTKLTRAEQTHIVSAKDSTSDLVQAIIIFDVNSNVCIATFS